MTAERGVVLVLLPAGSFRMGSESSAAREEKPAHDVRVPAFLASKYELTQAQWKRLTGREPSQYGPDPYGPVEQVSWTEVVAALPRVGLRLPSEAEWEYGARARTTTDWWTGDHAPDLATAANLADRSAIRSDVLLFSGEAWDDGHDAPSPVGSYRPNAFGLHDTIGNVWEWCEDTYQPDYAGRAPRTAPRGDWRDPRPERIAAGASRIPPRPRGRPPGTATPRPTATARSGSAPSSRSRRAERAGFRQIPTARASTSAAERSFRSRPSSIL